MVQLPNIVYGAFPLSFLPKEEVTKLISLLKENGVNEWDTARIYPGSEKAIGELKLSSDVAIDTKARSFVEGALTRKSLHESIAESFHELKVKKVKIFYLHAPDPTTPIEETIDTIDELYKQGKFEKFGLSNYSAKDVEEICEYAKSNGKLLPSVFQGNYNAFSRGSEEDLFPVLRKYGISFYAYSPIAGGFLVKSAQEIKEGTGRFRKGDMIGELYLALYSRPALLEGLNEWGSIAEKYDIPKAHLAYRWVAFHSILNSKKGDAIIIGGRNYEQVSDTLDAFKEGALPKETVEDIEKLWTVIKHEAPLNNYVQ